MGPFGLYSGGEERRSKTADEHLYDLMSCHGKSAGKTERLRDQGYEEEAARDGGQHAEYGWKGTPCVVLEE